MKCLLCNSSLLKNQSVYFSPYDGLTESERKEANSQKITWRCSKCQRTFLFLKRCKKLFLWNKRENIWNEVILDPSFRNSFRVVNRK